MNYIFIGAHARSGSTFLCKLLNQINEIKVYYEIFHFHQSVIEQHLFGDYQEIASQLSLPEDPGKARSELVLRHQEFLEILSRLNKDKPLAFKVFPNHIPDKHLSEIIEKSTMVILLRRNLLHSYISDVISMKTNKWGGVDTSLEKALFSQNDFHRHIKKILISQRKLTRLAEKATKPILTLNYENLIQKPEPLNQIMPMLSEKVGIQLSVSIDKLRIQKQDSRKLASEKVSNPSEMLSFLRKVGLDALDNGQLNIPDDCYSSSILGL